MLSKLQNEFSRIIQVSNRYGIAFGMRYFGIKFIYRDDVKFEYQQERYYSKIRRYLKDRYVPLVSYDTDAKYGTIKQDSIFWVMWWQGEDNMPPLVKAAYRKLRENAGDHRVVLLTNVNISEYIQLPEYIVGKYNKSIITLTHLTDIIRFKLLYEYGGFWIDSTIFMEKPLEENIYSFPVYTIKHGKGKPLCMGLWSAYFWGGAKGNPFFKYVYDLFCEYWKKENYLIDYFLVDCAVRCAYETVPEIKKMIDIIPENNKNVYNLENSLNTPMNSFEMDPETYIYKLNWKRKHLMDIANQKTVYEGLVNDKL